MVTPFSKSSEKYWGYMQYNYYFIANIPRVSKTPDFS